MQKWLNKWKRARCSWSTTSFRCSLRNPKIHKSSLMKKTATCTRGGKPVKKTTQSSIKTLFKTVILGNTGNKFSGPAVSNTKTKLENIWKALISSSILLSHLIWRETGSPKKFFSIFEINVPKKIFISSSFKEIIKTAFTKWVNSKALLKLGLFAMFFWN